MKKQFLMATVGACLMALPTMAVANDNGWYLRGNAGGGVVTDMRYSGDIIGSTQGEANAGGGLAIGYDFGDNWRAEFNVDQLWNDLGAINPGHNSTADLRMTNFMLDLYYDFSEFGNLVPYVGAGVGMNNSKLRAAVHSTTLDGGVINNSAACPSYDNCTFSSVDSAFAYNLLAGFGYQLSDKLVWDTQYRYTNVNDLDFNGIGRSLQTPISLGNFGPHNDISTTASGVGSHVLLTGLRYHFGARAPKPEPVMYTCWDGSSVEDMSSCPAEPPKVEYTTCWDGSQVEVGTACPARPVVNCWDGSTADTQENCPARPVVKTVQCWDGSTVTDASQCPADTRTWHTCADGSRVSDAAFCSTPVTTTYTGAYNNCGTNSVAIFSVPTGKSPKNITKLGTMPEFGDSHGLTPSQFYDKLAKRYANNAYDRKYLDYLFRSMGYSNGFKDAHAGLFSEANIVPGTTGLLGLGEKHHYVYSQLNTSARDLEAFRIQSANGTEIYFMKTCGNYLYPCNQIIIAFDSCKTGLSGPVFFVSFKRVCMLKQAYVIKLP